jgi:hypothetical protein
LQIQAESLEGIYTPRGIKPAIPYPSNQRPAEAEFLRIDKRFKAHGPEKAL